ncbi:MAG: glycosyltransferase family 4 protein [Dehalococcoidia bacterium]|nr:glycosyltransferase family 4 protein [Dehalococcoidia bacterium]
MPLRVCITWAGVLLSIGGLSESEFRQRINKASGGKIQVTFVRNKEECQRSDSNVVAPWENKQPPWLLSYPPVCLRNLPSLIRQDVLVAGAIGMSGVVVCLLSKLFKKKSMITIHGHYEEEWSLKRHCTVKNLLFAAASKFILGFADLFVANDQQIAQKLISKGVQASRVSVRRVFADTKKFSRACVSEDGSQKFLSVFGLPDKYVLYVGRLTSWDGAQDMFEIIKRIHSSLPAVKFVLIGEGPLKPWISQSVAEDNLSGIVFQIDRVSHELMPFAYYGADALVCPLHPPQSGVGRITLEALSMEVPVVAYDIGELHLVVRNDETGYLVLEGDTDLTAARTISLLMAPNLRAKFGRSGRKLVQCNYDVDTYIGNWLQSLYSLGST